MQSVRVSTLLPCPPRLREDRGEFDTLSSFQLLNPVRERRLDTVVLGLCLVMFAVADLAMVVYQASGRAGDRGLFVLAWMAVWTLLGLACLKQWLWNMSGREHIAVTADELVIVSVVGPLSAVRRYPREAVANLRYAPYDASGAPVSPDLGLVAFDCQGRVCRLGVRLDSEEAEYLVERLHRELVV